MNTILDASLAKMIKTLHLQISFLRDTVQSFYSHCLLHYIQSKPCLFHKKRKDYLECCFLLNLSVLSYSGSQRLHRCEFIYLLSRSRFSLRER